MAFAERPEQTGSEDTQGALVHEGVERGAQQGRREMLLRQLRRRFGDLPEAVVARVTTADSHALGVWGERVITARTLDEVWRGR